MWDPTFEIAWRERREQRMDEEEAFDQPPFDEEWPLFEDEMAEVLETPAAGDLVGENKPHNVIAYKVKP